MMRKDRYNMLSRLLPSYGDNQIAALIDQSTDIMIDIEFVPLTEKHLALCTKKNSGTK